MINCSDIYVLDAHQDSREILKSYIEEINITLHTASAASFVEGVFVIVLFAYECNSIYTGTGMRTDGGAYLHPSADIDAGSCDCCF